MQPATFWVNSGQCSARRWECLSQVTAFSLLCVNSAAGKYVLSAHNLIFSTQSHFQHTISFSAHNLTVSTQSHTLKKSSTLAMYGNMQCCSAMLEDLSVTMQYLQCVLRIGQCAMCIAQNVQRAMGNGQWAMGMGNAVQRIYQCSAVEGSELKKTEVNCSAVWVRGWIYMCQCVDVSICNVHCAMFNVTLCNVQNAKKGNGQWQWAKQFNKFKCSAVECSKLQCNVGPSLVTATDMCQCVDVSICNVQNAIFNVSICNMLVCNVQCVNIQCAMCKMHM